MQASRLRRPAFRAGFRLLGRSLARTFYRPQMLAFVPALALGGYWFGGQGVLMILALTAPMILVLSGLFDRNAPEVDHLTGLLVQESLADAIDDALHSARTDAEGAIVILLEIDDSATLAKRLGPLGMETIICRLADRIFSVTRGNDRIARIGEHRFGILLFPVRNSGMDIALRAVERLQGAVSEPFSLDAGSVYLTVSAGVCLERRSPERTGETMIAAALTALEEARVTGHGAVRSYSAEMQSRIVHRDMIAADLPRALENGEIRPWFQPQICARTGQVSGMEALARWHHPQNGIIPPADFLPAAEATGQMERLGEVMLFHGLAALRRWDKVGLHVPAMSVNFSGTELRNPKLVEKVRWELDRFDLEPSRLTVEVLETVVVGADDDTITSNIAGLSHLGCMIDLDDFGIGAASIANIRRFAVSRIKIDRSFITRVDADHGQRKMVDALLSLAAKLDLATVAEGVETIAEHALLREMGCDVIQGFAIARPMPLEEAEAWLSKRVGGMPEYDVPASATA